MRKAKEVKTLEKNMVGGNISAYRNSNKDGAGRGVGCGCRQEW